MNMKKMVLAKLDQCYAINSFPVNGVRQILLATEGHGPCYSFTGDDLIQNTVWEGPGGTMSMIPIPGGNGSFLAVQKFFPPFQSADAEIVWVSPQADGTYDVQSFLHLPYVHRFDLIRSGNEVHFVGATLCSSKRSPEDWTDPGKIWVGILPKNAADGMALHPILEGLTKNHGYCRVDWQGREAACFSAEDGVFLAYPPQTSGAAWRIEPFLDFPVSDIAFCDVDQDGEYEILTIEPFHGRRILIRKKICDRYEVVWEYDRPAGFGHVAWGGRIRGVPTFIAGYRENDAALFMIQADQASGSGMRFTTTQIDTGGGPSNVSVWHESDADVILASNRSVGEGVLYRVTDL